ncbi:Tetraacyldisaccharide 4'-kinase [Pseudovibrio axinellae]|uniref:Tetraacyldisaccharide 4'-kinase n=1 Tax=Pseudovibrio axinellae TaxID=989403 RepID=A0A165YDI0_9HYPH|nr:tetraacyldisaccharide 4'-kinase [Pseudovibrio axinellae]KZL18744.1 Tetraacyldisaccharide 4'-kinase [Pseudovibrio axinellae]SEP94400.1 lipid-A-disaccharide kinase [Pseudovibrio axinellae]
MNAPEFWWTSNSTWQSRLLSPLSALYGYFSAKRFGNKPRYKADKPVICIGNFTAGGTGKTPFALALNALLLEAGHKPGFLLRGYGGTNKGPLVVDQCSFAAEEVGDEALLLARRGPTVISADRVAGAKLLEQQDISVIIMDDGFQNPSLHKDFSIVLLDAKTGIGNAKCIPAGPLRMPFEKQLPSVSLLMVIGEGECGIQPKNAAECTGIDMMSAAIRPISADALEGERVLAFAGIGRPEKLFASLREVGADVVEAMSFPDHHYFKKDDARKILKIAEAQDLLPITTTKDYVRLDGREEPAIERLANVVSVLEVEMKISDPEALMNYLKPLLENGKA